VVMQDVPGPHQYHIVMDKGWLLVSVSLTLRFFVPQQSSTAEVRWQAERRVRSKRDNK